MTSNDMREYDAERQALIDMLDTFGGDRSRWPAAERKRFANLIRDDAQAARLVREARALDALLDHAPAVSAALEDALKASLIEKVSAEGRTASYFGDEGRRGAVIDLGRRRESGGPVSRWPLVSRPRMGSMSAAALMAASLMLGILAGANGWVRGPADTGVATAELSNNGMSVQSLLGGDIDSSDDEDIL